MHLTLDIPFSEKTQTLLTDQTLAKLLGLGALSYHNMPLEAYIAASVGLQATPDYPLAAISGLADMVNVHEGYWLRADPVHLVMQRDAFSLGEPIPMALSDAEAPALLETLNMHFAQDGLTFVVGQSGQWYVQTAQIQAIKTALPAEAVHQNVHQHMPTGQDSAKWRGIVNEIQMLLHAHPVNAARELQKQAVINSIWFSGGGTLPMPLISSSNSLANKLHELTSHSVFYAGLAKWLNLPHQGLLKPTQYVVEMLQKDLCKNQHSHVHLSELQSVDLAFLLKALKARKLNNLTLNLGFYAHTLVLNVIPSDLHAFLRYAFWQALFQQKLPTLTDYLARLNTA